MEVPISEQNLAHIMRKVESGRYSSPDEVLDSALALLDERDTALESELNEMRESVRTRHRRRRTPVRSCPQPMCSAS